MKKESRVRRIKFGPSEEREAAEIYLREREREREGGDRQREGHRQAGRRKKKHRHTLRET